MRIVALVPLAATGLLAGCPDTLIMDDVADDDAVPCCFGDGDGDLDGDVDVDADSDADVDGDADADQMWEEGEQVLQEFCDDFTSTYCLAERSCCAGGWTEQGVQTCRDDMDAFCELLFGDTFHFDRAYPLPEVAAECWATIRRGLTQACPADGPGSASQVEQCAGLFIGRVATWQPCTFSFECEDPEARCIYDDELAPMGLCDVPPTEGWACTFECAAGLACRDGVCIQPSALDAPCSVLGNGEDSCVDGAYCTAEGRCAGRLPAYAACELDRACWSGACEGGTCADDSFDYCWPDSGGP